jgi:hypothetical protein
MTEVTDRSYLDAFLTATDASATALERPVCRGWVGDYQISGKTGYVLSNGVGYLLYVHIDERTAMEREPSSRPWKNAKAGLTFCKVTQDGDWEGCLHLDRLPTDGIGAVTARLAVFSDAQNRRHSVPIIPETEAAFFLRARVRNVRNGTSSGADSAKNDGGSPDAAQYTTLARRGPGLDAVSPSTRPASSRCHAGSGRLPAA